MPLTDAERAAECATAAALLPNVLAALGCCCSVTVGACRLWLSEARGRVHGLWEEKAQHGWWESQKPESGGQLLPLDGFPKDNTCGRMQL